MTYKAWQPIAPQRATLLQSSVAAGLIGFLAGTGGDVSRDRIVTYSGTGSIIVSSLNAFTGVPVQGLTLELNVVRQVLRLSIAETASLFGVSRPTIYSWEKGNQLGNKNSSRLRAIFNALTPHLKFLQIQAGRIAHRAIQGRTTLLQKLSEGGDAQQAIMKLVALLVQETAQRERLSLRLQGRTGDRGAADLDALG
jgi:transcriptional regulator with XRE-family HTH domain